MRRQLGESLIGQVGDHPFESRDRRQLANIAIPDPNERILVAANIERHDLETGATQLERHVAMAGGWLQHHVLDRDRAQQRRDHPRRVESQISVIRDPLEQLGAISA